MDGTPASGTLLCRHHGATCGACCWGVDVTENELQTRLRQHRKLFQRFGAKLPSRWQCLLHEILVRRGSDLFRGLLYLLPVIGRKLRQQHGRKLVCAFIGFDDETETSVGCLLHPTRFQNIDVRSQRAFSLLPGVSCGDRNYVCRACDRYDQLSMVQQIGFDACIEPMGWYDYTNTIRAFSCTAVVEPDTSGGESSAA